ncbi:hypothetical protein BsWGS_21608 [Bradybaena similaris]
MSCLNQEHSCLHSGWPEVGQCAVTQTGNYAGHAEKGLGANHEQGRTLACGGESDVGHNLPGEVNQPHCVQGQMTRPSP